MRHPETPRYTPALQGPILRHVARCQPHPDPGHPRALRGPVRQPQHSVAAAAQHPGTRHRRPHRLPGPDGNPGGGRRHADLRSLDARPAADHFFHHRRPVGTRQHASRRRDHAGRADGHRRGQPRDAEHHRRRVDGTARAAAGHRTAGGFRVALGWSRHGAGMGAHHRGALRLPGRTRTGRGRGHFRPDCRRGARRPARRTADQAPPPRCPRCRHAVGGHALCAGEGAAHRCRRRAEEPAGDRDRHRRIGLSQ